MEDIKLKENIYWIGYVHWDVRNFHGYVTNRGSTYNSYFIKDEKNAVIDSVREPFADKLVENIMRYSDLNDIDYIICNHAEPDHSGSLPHLMDLCPNAELVCNAKCKKALSSYYNTDNWNFKIVDEGDELSLGNHTLKFVNTPMAHWPESMATYVVEEKVLFSMDAFGQHYASSKRFDDEVPLDEALYEAKKYYANIIMLYEKPVQAALKKASGLDIEIIAPSHGIIWRSHIPKIIEAYKEWSVCKSKSKILIFYDTMWHSTERMAEAMYEGAQASDVEIKKYDLKATNITTIATEALDSAVMAVGSSTLNKNLMPNVAHVMTYLKGLSPTGISALAFGSYGWAKKSAQHQVLEYLKEMNLELIEEEPIQCKFAPTEDVLERCRAVGEEMRKEALKAAE